ncbi:MAG: T9SS type A sorting domain-containing protein [Bacteroidetes bacterium]|nr:T9SS type A sorting domain-containing protein [Bacteroidota bacterium]
MKTAYIWVIVFMCAAMSMRAQQLALKETFSRDGQLLMFIANMDTDLAPEYVVMIDSSATIAIIDGRTRITEYTVRLNIDDNENLYTDDLSSVRLRNLTIVQDFNGNGMKDLIITGGAPEPYFRVADPKTGEDLLKVVMPQGDRQADVLDMDGDGYYELILSAGFFTNIYATQARVAETSGADSDIEKQASGLAMYPNFPNPVKGATTLAWEQPSAKEATVTIYDAQGRAVRRVFAGLAREGVNLCRWNGDDSEGKTAPSGTYQARVESGGKAATGTLQIAR